MRNEKKIIAIDFDGTIVHNKFPFIENPDMELIQFIKNNRDKYIWILWTCRVGRQLKYAIDYMRDEHGITFDYVNSNCLSIAKKYGRLESRKIFADYYIDDRNIDWKELVNEN